MIIKRLIALITTVLLATTLAVPSFAASSSAISFEGLKSIETTVGTGQHLQGTVKSSDGSKLSSVKAEVLSGSNDVVKSAKVNVNTNSYKLYDSDLDWSVPFGQLKAGTYTLKLTAKTNDGGSASKKVSVTVKSKSGSKQDSSGSTSDKFSGSGCSNMKQYSSDYYVVKEYDKKYQLDQNDYKSYQRSSGNVGCSAVCACMAISMKNGKVEDADKYYHNGGWCSAGATWKGTTSISAKGKDAYLRQIADQLMKGKAVVVWANDYHAVCAIGIREGANLNKLSASDILIIDPFGGKVTTLDKSQRGGYVYTGCSLHVAA